MPVTAWRKWVDEIAAGIASVPDEYLACAARAILKADLTVTAGNGGSSALASHAAQAIAKPDYKAGGGRAAVCLTDGVPALTAHANDGGWVTALAETARPMFDHVRNAVLLAISSSGNSPNILALTSLARDRRLPIIALTGFDGGALRQLATISLHVESRDYEIIEPAHDAILHRVQYHLREGRRAPL